MVANKHKIHIVYTANFHPFARYASELLSSDGSTYLLHSDTSVTYYYYYYYVVENAVEMTEVSDQAIIKSVQELKDR